MPHQWDERGNVVVDETAGGESGSGDRLRKRGHRKATEDVASVDVPAQTAAGFVVVGKAAGGEGKGERPLWTSPRDCRGGRRTRRRDRAHPWGLRDGREGRRYARGRRGVRGGGGGGGSEVRRRGRGHATAVEFVIIVDVAVRQPQEMSLRTRPRGGERSRACRRRQATVRPQRMSPPGT